MYRFLGIGAHHGRGAGVCIACVTLPTNNKCVVLFLSLYLLPCRSRRRRRIATRKSGATDDGVRTLRHPADCLWVLAARGCSLQVALCHKQQLHGHTRLHVMSCVRSLRCSLVRMCHRERSVMHARK
jgi:hypothetical protein